MTMDFFNFVNGSEGDLVMDTSTGIFNYKGGGNDLSSGNTQKEYDVVDSESCDNSVGSKRLITHSTEPNFKKMKLNNKDLQDAYYKLKSCKPTFVKGNYDENEIEYDDSDHESIEDNETIESLKNKLAIVKLKHKIYNIENSIMNDNIDFIFKIHHCFINISPILFKTSVFYKKYKTYFESQCENSVINNSYFKIGMITGSIITGYLGLFLYSHNKFRM